MRAPDAARRGAPAGARFAVVSENLPPSTRSPGQAGMMYRLLAPLDPASYCLISRVDYGAERYAHAPKRLPATYHRLSSGALPAPDAGAPDAAGAPAGRSDPVALARRLGNVAGRAREIAALLRRERCSAVVACPDRVGDLPIAYAASRIAGARFYPYFFDYYSAWFNSGPSGLAARAAEPLILRRAARVIVPNEGLGETLARRYGVEPAVIHNACDLSAYEAAGEPPAAAPAGELVVTFTGAVYDAHHEGLRTLLAALGRGPRPGRLHLYTPAARERLGDYARSELVAYHGYASPAEMPSIQRGADLLFLPLAFHSPFPEVIRTSAPAKMAEYLAAARPILVHAPPGSFVADYFRRHDCGLVVCTLDPAEMARALDRLRDDRALRERLARNAWARARADFDLERARARFASLLGVSPARAA